MQQIHRLLVVSLCILILAAVGNAADKYVGVKACVMCHKTEQQGKQLDIWQKSKHSEAFKVLTSARADSIAKAKGSAKPAAESPECLKCHVVGHDVGAELVDKNFDYKDGVQCEACHGAGSGYKTLAIMKDKQKAMAAGLKMYKDNGAIEKLCRTCHNDKSPVFKGFKFEESWAKIKHPKPKS